MILHTLNKADLKVLAQASTLITSSDTLLLIESALSLINTPELLAVQCQKLGLLEHCNDEQKLKAQQNQIPLISYKHWLSLTEQASAMQSWY